MFRKYMTEVQFRMFKQEQLKSLYTNVKSINELYPKIERIEIEYIEEHRSAFGVKNFEHNQFFNPQDLAIFVINCLNKECSSVGFDFKNDIYTMQRTLQTELSGEKRCDGQEAPDHPEQSCGGTLKYTIRITYKQ